MATSEVRKSNLERASDDYNEKMHQRNAHTKKNTSESGNSNPGNPHVNENNTQKENASERQSANRGNARKSNLDIAQEDYEQRMGAHPGQNNVPEEDIQKDIGKQLEKLVSGRKREHSNAVEKILSGNKNKLETLKEFAETEMTQGTDFGRGVKEYRETAAPLLAIIGDISRSTMAASMRISLENNKKLQNAYKIISEMQDQRGNYIFPATELKNLSMNDIRDINNGILKALHEKGLTKITKDELRDPVKVNLLIKKLRITGKLSDAEAKALAIVANATTKIDGVYGGRWNSGKNRFVGKHRFGKFTIKKTKKYMRQDDTGNAIIWYGKIVKAAKTAIRYQLKITALAFKAARFVTKHAAKASLKAAIKLAKTKLGQKIISKEKQQSIKKTTTEIKKKADKLQKGVSDKTDKVKNALKPNKRGRDAANSWNPLTRFRHGIRQKARKITSIPFRGKYNPLRIVVSALGNIFSFTQRVKRILVGMLVAFITFYGVCMIIMLVITGILNGFSFDSRDEALKDSMFTAIEECYAEQLQAIENASTGNTRIEVIDKKSNEAYENEENFEYTETTNITELLSMAIVYFEGDLEGQPTSQVTKYLKEMYYGSHDIVASTDENGDTVVTVTTYYFDDLFNCPRKTSFGGMGLMQDGSLLNGTTMRVHFTTYQASPSQGGTNDAYGRPLNPDDHTVAVPSDGDDVGLTLGTQIQIVNMEGVDKYNNTTWTIRDHGAGWWSATNAHQNYQRRELGSIPNIDILTASPEGISCYGTIIIGDGTGYATETPVSDSNLPAAARQHLQKLQEISNYVKANGSSFKKNEGKKCNSFTQAKAKVSQGQTVSLNCAVPTKWSLEAMGLIDGEFYYKNKWHGLDSKLSRKVKKVTAANGMTVEKAAKQNLLQPGDIIGFTLSNGHTATYAGKDASGNPLCYEAGGELINAGGYRKKGVGPINYNNKNNYIIANILRWK